MRKEKRCEGQTTPATSGQAVVVARALRRFAFLLFSLAACFALAFSPAPCLYLCMPAQWQWVTSATRV